MLQFTPTLPLLPRAHLLTSTNVPQACFLPVGIFQSFVLVLPIATPLPMHVDGSGVHSQNQVCMLVAWQDPFEALQTSSPQPNATLHLISTESSGF